MRVNYSVEVTGLGARIKAGREATGKKVYELATEVGFSPAMWYSMEAETIPSVPIETIQKVERVLGVSLGVPPVPSVSVYPTPHQHPPGNRRAKAPRNTDAPTVAVSA